MKILIKIILLMMIGVGTVLHVHSSEDVHFNNECIDGTAPCTVVIFGATGDLTARKLIPALYHLDKENHLSPQTAVVGFARGVLNDESFRNRMKDAVKQFSRTKTQEDELWNIFESKLFYHQSDYDQDEGYANLKERLSQIAQERGTQGNCIFYLATPPSTFPAIIQKLHEHGLIYDPNDEKWSRVIIEKPFGDHLDSAILLQEHISKYLDESQIYRMDHYLGKEGVQNLLTFRFQGALFEPLWNSQYIDNIQITMSEDIGIGTRGSFWEETGFLRDVFQNHLMQLLAMVAMEPPSSLTASHIHAEKINVLNAIRPFPLSEIDQHVIPAQYGPGQIHGSEVLGYRQENNVSEFSIVETFLAAKLFIDNDRWNGVPFYIRGGKRLPKQTTEIAVTFKKSNPLINQANVLFIRIQPNTGIYLKTVSKVPMLDKEVKSVTFGFNPDKFFEKSSPEAYEKLIYDSIRGDSSLFVQAEEQLAAWKLLSPILDYWKANPVSQLPSYEAGTWGPQAADELLSENGHEWLHLD